MPVQRSYFVYILTNKPFGTLYLGITGDLEKRIYDHKIGVGSLFTAKYKLGILVYYEIFEDPTSAIQREKTMKKWPRQWKLNKIIERNPDWEDLYETLQF